MVAPWVDFDAAKQFVSNFLESHARSLSRISETASQVFEAVVIVRLAESYEQSGYDVSVLGQAGNTFRFKFSTRGHPSRYSHFLLKKDGKEFVLCHNLSVKGRHAVEVVFSLDAAVASRPDFDKSLRAKGVLENTGLVTFAECKHLVAYPMLLAQFIGVVNELLPDFLSPGFQPLPGHPYPTLFVSGNASGNVGKLLESFANRGFKVTVLPNSRALAERDIRALLQSTAWIAFYTFSQRFKMDLALA